MKALWFGLDLSEIDGICSFNTYLLNIYHVPGIVEDLSIWWHTKQRCSSNCPQSSEEAENIEGKNK